MRIAELKLNMAVDLSKSMESLTKLNLQQDKYPLERLVLDKKIDELTMQKQEYEKKKRQLQTEVHNLETTFNSIRDELKMLRQHADSTREQYLDKHPELTVPEFNNMLGELPEDEYQIRQEIDIKEAQIHNDPHSHKRSRRTRVCFEQL